MLNWAAFTSLSARDLLSSPLLYWTLATMMGGCLTFAVIGAILDCRDAKKLKETERRSGWEQATKVIALESLVADSMPRFVTSMRRPLGWICHMLLKNHSWCKIMTVYVPATSRPRRAARRSLAAGRPSPRNASAAPPGLQDALLLLDPEARSVLGWWALPTVYLHDSVLSGSDLFSVDTDSGRVLRFRVSAHLRLDC